MDKSHPLSSLMVVHSLEVTKDLFCPKEDNEKLLGPKVPYYNVIVHRWILQIIHDQILHSLLIYLWDIVLHQLRDIRIKSIMYYNNMGLCYSEGSES